MADLTPTERDSDPVRSFAGLRNECSGTAPGLVSDRVPAGPPIPGP